MKRKRREGGEAYRQPLPLIRISLKDCEGLVSQSSVGVGEKEGRGRVRRA